MFINKNSNISKALNIFSIKNTSNDDKKRKNHTHEEYKLDLVVDDLFESQYITRNFQIGITYVQIAKSTLSKTKDIIGEMKEIYEKSKTQENTSFVREALNSKFEGLCKEFNKHADKLNIDIRENLFYTSKNELVFKVFDSSNLDECILIPKLDANKLMFRNINIKNVVNAEIANKKMDETIKYILSSEESIKNSEDKLLKVNLTDIMSQNLLALSSNEDKESIQNLIDLTRKGIIKDGYSYYIHHIKKKNIDDLLK